MKIALVLAMGAIKVGILLLAPLLIVEVAEQVGLHVTYMQVLMVQLWMMIATRS